MSNFDRAALAQNDERCARYQANLTDYARDYLLAHRGLNADLVAKYRFGICDDTFPGRLSIPYLREPHGVAWFNYRALDGETPKYKAFGEKHIYNTAAFDVADESGEIYIAEGEFDAVVATELFGLPAVGIPGATQWSGNRHWRELFVGYPKIYVLADPDDAGLGLAQAICESLPSARIVALPHDVTDCWRKNIDIRELVR